MSDINVTVKFEDNSNKVLSLFDGSTTRGLDAIGATAERYAKKDCPVDTGRLRNSITYETRTLSKEVYIGTNVEYGPYVELGTSRMAARPFIRPAASNHPDEYKRLMEDSLKNA